MAERCFRRMDFVHTIVKFVVSIDLISANLDLYLICFRLHFQVASAAVKHTDGIFSSTLAAYMNLLLDLAVLLFKELSALFVFS